MRLLFAASLVALLGGCAAPQPSGGVDPGTHGSDGAVTASESQPSDEQIPLCDCKEVSCEEDPLVTQAWGPGPTADEGSEAFSVAMDEWGFRVAGSNGAFVNGQWSFRVVDEADAVVYDYVVTAPVTAVGEDNNVPAGLVEVRPGDLRLEWEVQGILTQMQVQILGLSCPT